MKKKNTSGGLILSLEKFRLILYFNVFQKNIYVVKNTSSEWTWSYTLTFYVLDQAKFV